jgi:aminoglycoside phosphotransferase family enzyme/gluconate kinase
VIEYAVTMRQFPPDALASEQVKACRFDGGHIDRLAARVADFHGRVSVAAADSAYGDAGATQHWTLENFDYFGALPANRDREERTGRLRDWVAAEYERRREHMVRRKADGYIRECHGDLHLGNIVVLDDDPVPFDCIEFNEQLRWIDVLNDTAFLVMDLHDHGRPALARRLLNRYLALTADYGGVPLLRYYLVYRALVRAKVAALRAGDNASSEAAGAAAECDNYLELAEAFARPAPPLLVITHGYSGSGKSHLAAHLAEAMDAIHLRSDVERKRLFDYDPADQTHSAVGGGIYTERASLLTYDRLSEHAAAAIEGGYTAIVDAAFLKDEQRRRFAELAEALNVPWIILDCEAPVDVLKSRIAHRRPRGADASEADETVLASQLETSEPFDDQQRRHTVTVNTVAAPPPATIVRRLRRHADQINEPT